MFEYDKAVDLEAFWAGAKAEEEPMMARLVRKSFIILAVSVFERLDGSSLRSFSRCDAALFVNGGRIK
jgi:hypothetical protein